MTRLVHFFAIVLTAFILAPSAAHLFALPNKIGLDARDYFTVQGIYRGWALFGALIIPALIVDALLAFLLRHDRLRFWLATGAAAGVALSLVVFFIWVFPGNAATSNWTAIPPDWRSLRARWEFGHAASAVIMAAAMCALTAAAFVSHGHSRYGP